MPHIFHIWLDNRCLRSLSFFSLLPVSQIYIYPTNLPETRATGLAECLDDIGPFSYRNYVPWAIVFIFHDTMHLNHFCESGWFSHTENDVWVSAHAQSMCLPVQCDFFWASNNKHEIIYNEEIIFIFILFICVRLWDAIDDFVDCHYRTKAVNWPFQRTMSHSLHLLLVMESFRMKS